MRLGMTLNGLFPWLRREGGETGPFTPRPAAKAAPGGSAMAARSETLARQLALVIDLDVCVGCQACVVSCKQWNSSGRDGLPPDPGAWQPSPSGTFFRDSNFLPYEGRKWFQQMSAQPRVKKA
jgi:hypothetical protein